MAVTMAASVEIEAFDRLLASLGPDRETAGRRYLEIRANLVRLFEWRGCATPEEYADEAMNRCARKLGDGVEIQDVGSYAVGVARMLVLEMNRARAKAPLSLEKAPEPYTLPVEPVDDSEAGVNCLRCCLAKLSPENRDLILLYYQGDKGDKIENRKALSQRFGVPAGTLRMRALRLRESLQSCAQDCIRCPQRNRSDRFPVLDSSL
jgi:DNA-directed RNA polymerase specialized sigma24 family protein